MVKKSEHNLQKQTISEMNQLCNPRLGMNWSVHKASLTVSGEDDLDSPRQAASAQCLGEKLSSKTIRKRYGIWLDLGQLPCDVKPT